MIAEHRKCGGRGWLLYDCAFCQQISSLESADFSKVNQSLYTTTFLAYGGRGQFCVRCMASNHAQEECALHPNREVPVVQLQDHRLGRLRREEQALGEQRRRRGRRGACYAYNDGRCAIPFCWFEHICSVCGGGPQKGSMPNERAGAAAQRPGKRGSIYVNVKPLVPKSTAKNAIMSICHGFSFL